MTVRWRIAAPLTCVVLICGAAAVWAVYQRNAAERLAGNAKACRVRAEQGDAKAQYELAYLYHYGQGLPRDYSEGVRWLRQAADRGYAKAQYALGLSYRYGEGVVQDRAEALRWYRKAADQGYPAAQYAVGLSCSQGDGVPEDPAQAVGWYRKAADQGYAEAQFAVGASYWRGECVPKDRTEALRWFRKAADQGYVVAQYALAMRYWRGEGVPRDKVEASRWFGKVVAHCIPIGFSRWSILSLVLFILVLAVPRRRWGRAQWAPSALISAACAAALIHQLTCTSCRGNTRIFGIWFFALSSAGCALWAIIDAVRASKRGRSVPTPPPEGTQGSPT